MITRRRLLVSILLSACAVSPGWSGEPVRLRVLSYNIHHGAGLDGRLDLPRIAGVIQRSQADLVALQEVDRATRRSQGVDQAAELGRLTGMHAAFGKAMDYAGGQYGGALLSRWPLEDVAVHPLPAADGAEPRCAVAATVRIGSDGPRVHFAGTHLEHAQAAVRLSQADKLNEALVGDDSRRPTILAGDLNDVPDSPTLRRLLEQWSDATAEQPEPTFPAGEPRVKIDYVLYRPAERWRVVSREVLNEPIASDHRPLLVVLELLPGGADD